MITIYVDMSEATDAERTGLRLSDLSSSCKAALLSRSVTPDFSIFFTNERVIEQGRSIATTIASGVSPGPEKRANILAEEVISKAKE